MMNVDDPRCVLIAVPTVLPTLKSAREYCSKPRIPMPIVSGTRQQCYDRATKLTSKMNATAEESFNLPVLVTPDWTYWVVAIEEGER